MLNQLSTERPPVLRGVDILRPLGWGGSALVWLARQTALGRLCAVKQVPLDSDADASSVLGEARMLAGLSNPHIVAVYDASVVDGEALIVMELLPAGSLADWMRSQPPLWGDVLRIADQTADALATAARAGIVHRDVKPSNILLDERGGCHVADFGIATLLADRTRGPDGQLVGTPAYMSPEQARGEVAHPPSDVYSLGVIIYELLCGRLPFVNAEVMATVRDHASTPPPRPRSLRPDLPSGVERLLLQALDKRPRRRPEATELAGLLRQQMERVLPGVNGLLAPPPPRRLEIVEATRADGATFRDTIAPGAAEEPATIRPEEGSAGSGATAAGVPLTPVTRMTAPARLTPRARRRRPRTRPLALAACLTVAAGAAVAVRTLTAGRPPLEVTSVSAAGPAGAAHCPAAAVTITGRVDLTGGAGTLRFQWHRPDGSTTAEAAVDVDAGTPRLDTTLTLRFSGTNPSSGPVVLEVLSPTHLSSAPLSVGYLCP